jgi:hypothetical protein
MTNENDKLVTIAEYLELYDAEFAKNRLESESIKAMVVGEKAQGVYPFGGSTLYVQLKVFESDVEQAKSILESQESIEQGED